MKPTIVVDPTRVEERWTGTKQRRSARDARLPVSDIIPY